MIYVHISYDISIYHRIYAYIMIYVHISCDIWIYHMIYVYISYEVYIYRMICEISNFSGIFVQTAPHKIHHPFPPPLQTVPYLIVNRLYPILEPVSVPHPAYIFDD